MPKTRSLGSSMRAGRAPARGSGPRRRAAACTTPGNSTVFSGNRGSRRRVTQPTSSTRRGPSDCRRATRSRAAAARSGARRSRRGGVEPGRLDSGHDAHASTCGARRRRTTGAWCRAPSSTSRRPLEVVRPICEDGARPAGSRRSGSSPPASTASSRTTSRCRSRRCARPSAELDPDVRAGLEESIRRLRVTCAAELEHGRPSPSSARAPGSPSGWSRSTGSGSTCPAASPRWSPAW